jgi:tetratricopeptide (TPR) repeat protein
LIRNPQSAIRIALFVALSAALCAQAPAPLPLGRISFPNSGAASAQAPFIRGVLLLHSFEYDAAIAAFREAERIDPSFALAYWGEAMCFNQTLWYNENLAKGREALNRLAATPAARQAKAPTPREKAYLAAVEQMFGAGDKTARNRAYADRMADLHAQFPDDDEATVLYALALLGTQPESGARDISVMLKAGNLALGVLKKNPQHPGAAHYALHAFDDGEHAAMALEAARTYAKIAPASSHARHMPSHAFLPLGMWDEAAASDEAAFQTSIDLARAKGLSSTQYDFHALSWLQYEYLQQGRFSKARDAMRTVDAALGSAKASPSFDAGASSDARARGFSRAEHQHIESEIGRGYGSFSLKAELASMRARLVVESGAWDEMKGKTSFDNVDELFALGIASVKLGDEARAEAAFDQLQQARNAAPDLDNRQLAQIMSAEVAGLLQLARGQKAEALKTLGIGARLEAERPRPIARPYPVKPAAELYAEALLASGDAAGAVRQFQASLARTPRRAASLIGLARAAQTAGQRQLAAKTAREFIAMWHAADANRKEMSDAQAIAR